MAKPHEDPLSAASIDDENYGDSAKRVAAVWWQPQLRKLTKVLPIVMAMVLTVFAIRVTSEARQAFSGFSQVGRDAMVLSIGDIEVHEAVAQRHRRLLIGSGAKSIDASDVVALHVTLNQIASAAAKAQARFADISEPMLTAAAAEVVSESDDLALALAKADNDAPAVRSLIIRLDSLEATISRLRQTLRGRISALNAKYAQIERDSFNAMQKMFLSLVGAVLSMLLLLFLNRRAVRDAEYRADHDPVTSLINRRAFEAWISDREGGRGGRPSAVMIIDIDDFKQINDELGHAIGDHVLRSIACVFHDAFRQEATILRWGGDEFAAVIPLDGYVEAGAVSMLRAAFDTLQTVVTVEPVSVGVRCSAGVAFHPADDEDLSEVLKLAELALAQAKHRGKGSLHFFDKSLLSNRHRVISIRGRIRRALDEGHLHVYWQPQVDIARGSVPSAEALVRWIDPNSSQLISPMDFIPAIESTELIIELDHFVLDTAIASAASWSRRWSQPPMVAVNVSAIHFQQREFVSLVNECLRRHGVYPGCLELEITEGVILGENDEVRRNLDGLARLGVRIALDDFGTGYSNIAYLAQLKPDRLKIDQTFVRDLAGSNHMKSLVAAILGIGRAIDCEVVAEGVETVEQVEILRGLGCRLIQGYYFAKPMPAHAFEEWRDANWPEHNASAALGLIRRIGA